MTQTTTKKLFLKNGGYALVDIDDYKILNKYSWSHFNVSKSTYARATVNGKQINMHRVIMSAPKGMLVDHINGNGLDNRKINLRLCTHSENARNSRISSNNSSGFIGVDYKKSHKLWRARITLNRKEIFVGLFETAKEAHDARLAILKKYHEDFSYIPNL
jgi:hypothetical protein